MVPFFLRISRRSVSNPATAILAVPVTRYIIRHRNRLASRSIGLSETEKSQLRGYFPAATLDRVRIAVFDPLPVAELPFAGIVRRIGFDFPCVALTAAITFDHVIACREPMTPSLLFHELVHVVQYRLLGVRIFSGHYIHGFLNSGSYHRIPL